MSQEKFVITKALMEAYVNNGFTIQQMADDITVKAGAKCSPAWIRKAAKTYGINLLSKPRPTPFVLEDVPANEEKEEIVETVEEVLPF